MTRKRETLLKFEAYWAAQTQRNTNSVFTCSIICKTFEEFNGHVIVVFLVFGHIMVTILKLIFQRATAAYEFLSAQAP